MTTEAGPDIVTDGLVLSLDAANPKSYPGTGTVWSDLTNNGNNGTLIDGAGYDSAGGGSIIFNGTNNYVLVGPVANTGKSTISVSWGVWVYPTSTSGNIFSMSESNPASGWRMPPISSTSQEFRGKIWNNDLLTFPYSLNSWYYLVLVFDYSQQSQRFYVNGNLVGQQNPITYVGSGQSNYMFIGKSIAGANDTGMFTGKIGSFQIYTNKALSDIEVLKNFNALRGRYGI